MSHDTVKHRPLNRNSLHIRTNYTSLCLWYSTEGSRGIVTERKTASFMKAIVESKTKTYLIGRAKKQNFQWPRARFATCSFDRSRIVGFVDLSTGFAKLIVLLGAVVSLVRGSWRTSGSNWESTRHFWTMFDS